MKKTIIFFVVVLLVLTFAQTGNALTITVTDDPDPDVYLNFDTVNPIPPPNASYTPPAPNPFDLTAQLTGYTVTSATLTVNLRDNVPDFFSETFKIMDDDILLLEDNMSEDFTDPTDSFIINVLPVMNDKKLILTVQAVEGDFYYKDATLEVTYTPIPASLLLLGSGLLGLGALGWRRKRG